MYNIYIPSGLAVSWVDVDSIYIYTSAVVCMLGCKLAV